MITTTCLIGVVVGTLSAIAPRTAEAGEAGAAAAAAAVSALATSPAAATRLIRLTSLWFMGLPSPSVRELSGCRETAVKYLRASVSMEAVIVHGRNKG